MEKTCISCGKTFVGNTKYIRTIFARCGDESGGFHDVCKDCEKEERINEEWNKDKLKCHICGEWLDPSEFDIHRGNSIRNGRDCRCKKCKRKQNLEARANYSEEKRLCKILQERWLGARDRAKLKGRSFDITKEDLCDLWKKQNGLCALSGIPMTYEMDNGRIYTNVSIDQIDPGKGYTKDNTQLVCMGVNQMKSDLSMPELLFLCKQVLEYNT